MPAVEPIASILPLSSPGLTLENAGGKGLNLGRLTRLGLPVPAGFIVSADVYRDLVGDEEIARRIEAELTRLDAGDPVSLEKAARAVRGEIERWYAITLFANPATISSST